MDSAANGVDGAATNSPKSAGGATGIGVAWGAGREGGSAVGNVACSATGSGADGGMVRLGGDGDWVNGGMDGWEAPWYAGW